MTSGIFLSTLKCLQFFRASAKAGMQRTDGRTGNTFNEALQ